MVSAAIRHFFVILTLVHFITCSVKVLRSLKWCKICETYCLFSRLTQNRRLKKKRRYLTHLFTAMVFISLSFPPEWLLGLDSLQNEASCRTKAETLRHSLRLDQPVLPVSSHRGCVPIGCPPFVFPTPAALFHCLFLSYPASIFHSLPPHFVSFIRLNGFWEALVSLKGLESCHKGTIHPKI